MVRFDAFRKGACAVFFKQTETSPFAKRNPWNSIQLQNKEVDALQRGATPFSSHLFSFRVKRDETIDYEEINKRGPRVGQGRVPSVS